MTLSLILYAAIGIGLGIAALYFYGNEGEKKDK